VSKPRFEPSISLVKIYTVTSTPLRSVLTVMAPYASIFRSCILRTKCIYGFLAHISHLIAIISLNILKELGLLSRYSDWLRTARPWGRSSSPAGSRISPRRSDRLWDPASYPMCTGGRDVKLTTHLRLVPTSRKCASTHRLPPYASWRSA
jgi:hypothetical protein